MLRTGFEAGFWTGVVGLVDWARAALEAAARRRADDVATSHRGKGCMVPM
jgi:hypothetical protein